MIARCAAYAEERSSNSASAVETFEHIDIKIRTVTLNERVSLLCGLTLEAVGSGFAIGTCNWILANEHIRVGIMGASCIAAKRHPAPIDKSSFSTCDVMIAHGISTDVEHAGARVNQFGSLLATTLSRGGAVVVPVRINGVLFDLLDIASKLLRQTAVHVPMFLVSPQAKQAIAFANAYCMWSVEDRTVSGTYMLLLLPNGVHDWFISFPIVQLLLLACY
eukprot:m.109885 g.109885  ORF g.109885 m.109885 type:complete len:220 (-) comp15253_c0_seq3:43-702(-)